MSSSRVGRMSEYDSMPPTVQIGGPALDRASFSSLARLLLGLSSLRTPLLGSGQLSEAGWNMLLDLYVNEEQGRGASLSSLGIASGGPQTTSQRQILVLERLGLIHIESDLRDRRRRCVYLSAATRGSLDAYLKIASERIIKQVHGLDAFGV